MTLMDESKLKKEIAELNDFLIIQKQEQWPSALKSIEDGLQRLEEASARDMK